MCARRVGFVVVVVAAVVYSRIIFSDDHRSITPRPLSVVFFSLFFLIRFAFILNIREKLLDGRRRTTPPPSAHHFQVKRQPSSTASLYIHTRVFIYNISTIVVASGGGVLPTRRPDEIPVYGDIALLKHAYYRRTRFDSPCVHDASCVFFFYYFFFLFFRM